MNNKNKLTIVIFAGGRGTRLNKLTEDTLKPLIKVFDTTLVEYGIKWAEYLGADKIIVSGSYKFEVLSEFINKIDSEVVMVKDKICRPGARILGLLSTIDEIEGDVFFFDGDYIFDKRTADLIKNYDYQNKISVHAADKKSDYTAQDVIIEVDDNYQMKDMFKTKETVDLQKSQYYFNSLLYCPYDKLADLAKIAQESFDSGALHVEDAVLKYASTNIVKMVNLGQPFYIEVDNQSELKAAEKFINENKNFIV